MLRAVKMTADEIDQLKAMRVALYETQQMLAMEVMAMDDHVASLKAKFKDLTSDIAQLDRSITEAMSAAGVTTQGGDQQ